MSKVYIISDTHFGHDRVIEYCKRPYDSVEQMEEDLVLRWNNTVSKDDKVFHLGDFGFGSKEVMQHIVSRLNGRISIVLGNHDGHSVKWHNDVGFFEVSKYPIIYANEYIFSHAPVVPMADLTGDEPTPYKNIFGHYHNLLFVPAIGRNYACVSVENIGYKPMLFSELEKKMKLGVQNG